MFSAGASNLNPAATDAGARRLLSIAIFFGFTAGAMLVAQAWLFSLIIESVFLQGQTLAETASLFGWMLAAMGVRAAALLMETIVGQRSANRAKQALRQRLIEHLFRLGPIPLQKERTGDFIAVASEGVEALDAYISQYWPARILAVLSPLFTLLVVFLLDPWTSLVLVVAAPMLILMLALIGTRAKALTEQRFLELSWMSAFFLDMLQGLTTLKLFGRSKEQAETIRQISAHYSATTMKVLATAFQTSLVMEWASTAATALVALEVSYRLMAGHLALAPALTVLLLTPEFFSPLRTFALRYHAGSAGKAALERIHAVLATPVGQLQPTPAPTTNAHLLKAAAKPQSLGCDLLTLPAPIHFVHVSYAYAAREQPVLQDCTFTILPHRRTALIGASGAGKSTILHLLLRFLDPQQGEIRIGDVPLAHIPIDAWRAQVAWVGPSSYLFQGAVLDNLRLARPTASDEEIVAAAQAANAHEFIAALPDGYATWIGEQGVRLSAGQRQRLALARAFLKDAPFLLLDEPTAHLDPQNEHLVLEALERLMQGRTVLLVAHREGIVNTADDVILLKDGRVTYFKGGVNAIRSSELTSFS
jgi:thiol reductant ABC exporter CydD subunit